MKSDFESQIFSDKIFRRLDLTL